jgi:hypothetical protein
MTVTTLKRLPIINVLKNDNSSENVTAKIHRKHTYTVLKWIVSPSFRLANHLIHTNSCGKANTLGNNYNVKMQKMHSMPHNANLQNIIHGSTGWQSNWITKIRFRNPQPRWWLKFRYNNHHLTQQKICYTAISCYKHTCEYHFKSESLYILK